MPQTAPDLKCPHCGAKVGRNWTTCWLCGLELPGTLAESVPDAAPSTGPRVVATVAKVAGVFLAIAIALILFGLVSDGEYGGAIAMMVLLLPAGIVTLTKSLRRRSEGADFSTIEKVGTFFLSLAVTIGAIVALGVALFVALFVACLAMLATNGGGNMFH
ncbi:MAG TPA: hypothetical protein VL475_05270 [Planctomycetaceae bacterium]|nr:hypothetical protein [Planctomycetaceae bacterium]